MYLDIQSAHYNTLEIYKALGLRSAENGKQPHRYGPSERLQESKGGGSLHSDRVPRQPCSARIISAVCPCEADPDPGKETFCRRYV